jgi:hypothetical protein
MKFLLIIFIATIPFIAKANCKGDGIWCWPVAKNINTNAIIVIEFFANSQELVPELNKKYPVYLKSVKNRVELEVVEILKGEFNLTQVVCKPKSRLIPGYEYELKLDHLPKGAVRVEKWVQNESKTLPPKWTAVDQIDLQAPAWDKQPKYLSETYTPYGCGPAVHVLFSLSAKDASPILIKATVTNSKTGVTTSYYLVPSEGKIEVGHSMCAGAFAFEDDTKYLVKFSLMDASGNQSSGFTEDIQFTPPSS